MTKAYNDLKSEIEGIIANSKFADDGSLSQSGENDIKKLKEKKIDSTGKFKSSEDESAYNKAKNILISLASNKINEKQEVLKMEHFSEDVKKRNQERNIKSMEKEIRGLESKIAVKKLEIGELDNEIAEHRSAAG